MSPTSMSGGGGERAVIVRPAREADVPALGRLAAALVAFHVAIDPLRFMNIENAEVGYGRWLGKESADPEALVLVAEREGAVVGYAYARLEPKSYNELREACAVLHDILVAPEARGTGAGEALLRAVAREMKARGAPRLLLLTAKDNVTAQRLFAKVGFETTMLEMKLEL